MVGFISQMEALQQDKKNREIDKESLKNEQVTQGQALASTCFESNYTVCP
jgi:hypothetical protein